jgi:uncharacterized protein YuzE
MRVNVCAPKPVEIDLDLEHRVAYVRVRKSKPKRTIEHAPGVLLDVDAAGRLVGLEVLLPASAAGIDDASQKYLAGAEYGSTMSAVKRILQNV